MSPIIPASLTLVPPCPLQEFSSVSSPYSQPTPYVDIFLVTGAASGFGLNLTELILENGENVVATDIKLEGLADLQKKYTSDRLVVRKLDVAKQQEIAEAFSAAKDAFGKIDVVYNNAGYGIVAEAEAVPNAQARALFDVVYWGSVQVALEAVKFFREVNGPSIGGRLITTGSMLGIMTFPLAAYYSSAKHGAPNFIITFWMNFLSVVGFRIRRFR